MSPAGAARVAVVDIGGGTCDVAVLETTDSGPVVVAQTGDDRLGGNDLDDLLYRWVTDRLTTSDQSQIVTALDEPENLGAALTLLDVVRAAKQDLSEYPTAPVGVSVAGHDAVVTVSRDEYETLISAAMAQAAELLVRALHDSGTTTLARLHLTGGTAFTPALARTLHQVTGIMAEPLGDPTMAVATGALRAPDALATPAVRPSAPGASDADRPVAPVEPAVTMLGGRYELGEVIGRGGMAEVYLGRDQLLGRQVAIKIPHLSLVRDPTFRRRFAREAKLAGKLNHPAIVRVYDTDEADLPAPTGGQVRVPFIVMERVVGRPLGDLSSDGLSVDSALGIASDVLAALELAHGAGVVHRDIKPANVMVTASGSVKVMDFGIARSVAETGTTTTEGVIGTAAYLSPEQALGKRVDTRSDLYSAGCLLFEMLTGRPPFVGGSTVEVAYAHVNDTPPRPSGLAPHLPPVLDEVLAKALAKDCDARYPSATAFRADLDAVRRDPTTRPPGLPHDPAGAPTTVVPPVGPGTTATLPVGSAPLPQPQQRPPSQIGPRPVAPQQAPPASHRPGAAAAPAGWQPVGAPTTSRRSRAGAVVAAVAVVALVGVGAWGQLQSWWPWTRPAAGPTSAAGPAVTTTSASATPTPTPTEAEAEPELVPPVAAGTCLAADAVTLFYDDLRPDDWWYSTTDCGDGTNVEIGWVIPDDAWYDDSWTEADWADAWLECDDTTGCWWFSDGGFTYLVNTVPNVGACFYGFVNTAFPERGSRSANADLLHTGVCGGAFPQLDADGAADSSGLLVSDLVPAEFQIVELVGAGETCPDDSSPWRDITYAPETTLTVCSVVSYEVWG